MHQNHPSFGHSYANFQFAITSSDGAVRKILLVEAKNPAAVATIETILGQDGRVSDTCHILAVIYQSNDVSMRSDLVDDCSYIDFMIDVVDSQKLLVPAVSYYFQQSLTQEDREYASRKLRLRAESERSVAVQRRRVEYRAQPRMLEAKVVQVVPSEPDRGELVSSALTNMGFKKSLVQNWVSNQGSQINQGSVPDQIRNALRSLSS